MITIDPQNSFTKPPNQNFLKLIAKYIIRWIKWVCSTLIIILVLVSANSFKGVFDHNWYILNSPYNVSYEYKMSLFLGMFRGIMECVGFDRDGSALKGIKKWHYHVYLNGISKIPEEDAFRLVFYYYYELRPFISNADAGNFKILVPNFIYALKGIDRLKSKVPGFYALDKYIIIAGTGRYFFTESFNIKKSNDTELLSTLNDYFVLEALTFSKNHPLMHDPSYSIRPIGAALEIAQAAIISQFEIIKTRKKCPIDDIKLLKTLEDKKQEVINIYAAKELTPSANEELEEHKQNFPKLKAEISTWLKDNCGINDINEVQ